MDYGQKISSFTVLYNLLHRILSHFLSFVNQQYHTFSYSVNTFNQLFSHVLVLILLEDISRVHSLSWKLFSLALYCTTVFIFFLKNPLPEDLSYWNPESASVMLSFSQWLRRKWLIFPINGSVLQMQTVSMEFQQHFGFWCSCSIRWQNSVSYLLTVLFFSFYTSTSNTPGLRATQGGFFSRYMQCMDAVFN